MSKPILVGVDEHDRARDAVTLGSALAAALQDDLVVLNVYPYDPLANSLALGAPPDESFPGLAEEIVGRVADLAPGARRITRSARSVAAGLHQTALRIGAEVLVVGASHRGVIGQAMLGTNAARAARGAPCAVAVASRGLADADWKLGEIAVAYDGTAEAREALEFARRIAASSGAKLRLVDVTVPVLTGWGSYLYVPDDTGYRVRTRQIAETVLAVARGDETTEIRHGAIADELLAVTREVDLMVMGSRSYGPVRRTLLGSTSDAIVHRADCPVVVVPRSAHDEAEAAAADAPATAAAS
jgi:nucleotide-binding universal stress UspA family protein